MENFVRRPHPNRRGLTLAEIIAAIGFLAVFTTGLMLIASKSFTFSRQQVDGAAAYQYGEVIMENYALLSRDGPSWDLMTPVVAPKFTRRTKADGTEILDTRFVYTATIEDLDTDVRYIKVILYRARQTSAASGIPAIDTASARGGEILRMVNLYQREVNNG